MRLGFLTCGLSRFLPGAKKAPVAPAANPPAVTPALPDFPKPARPGSDPRVDAGKDGWRYIPGGPLALLDGNGNPVAYAHDTFLPGQNHQNTPRQQRLNTILPADAATGESLFAVSDSKALPLIPSEPIFISRHADAASAYLNTSAASGFLGPFEPALEPRERRIMTDSQAQATRRFDEALAAWDPDGSKRSRQEAGMVFKREKDADGRWQVQPAGRLVIGPERDASGWGVSFPKEQLLQEGVFTTEHSHPLPMPASVPDQNNTRKLQLHPGEPEMYNLVHLPDGTHTAYDGRFRDNPVTGRPELTHIDLIPPPPETRRERIDTPPPSPGAY